MYKVEVILTNETGLHARPASLLVKEASKYVSEIKLIKADREYNAKSIMGILSMGANKGTKLTIAAEGRDEKAAVMGLKALVDRGFSE
ncbi:MAG: HPr family phosphocarrier protein [Maledivibacter sp.]|jgi:phosphotransferase system HPr (HPr) family protein|nr:HPr family phosphocarrier protein [Maledivibacter sp.]